MYQNSNLWGIAYDIEEHTTDYQTWIYDDVDEREQPQLLNMQDQPKPKSRVRVAFATVLNIISK